MGKVFNAAADCKPQLHYMVDISGRIEEIKRLVDRGEDFTINRARQYGKTTTLRALKRILDKEYLVVSLLLRLRYGGETSIKEIALGERTILEAVV